MKECLECKKEFEPKNGKAKFCSSYCRLVHFRKVGKRADIKEYQMQNLYNKMMELASKINITSPISSATYDAPKLQPTFKDEPKQYQEPLDKLSQFLENIKYADSKKEIERYVAQAKNELTGNWKSFLTVQNFASEVMEKKGFIYND